VKVLISGSRSGPVRLSAQQSAGVPRQHPGIVHNKLFLADATQRNVCQMYSYTYHVIVHHTNYYKWPPKLPQQEVKSMTPCATS
jgi:hypothetical protein